MPLCDEELFATFKIFSTAYQIYLLQKAAKFTARRRKAKDGSYRGNLGSCKTNKKKGSLLT